MDWDLGIFYSPLVLPPAGQAPEPWDADSEITQLQRHPGGTWTPVVNANGPTPPPPVPKFRVELCAVAYAGTDAGKVTVIPASKSLGDLGTLVFDYNAKPLPAVVGFSVTETSPNVYEKVLLKMHTADRGVTYEFSLIGTVQLVCVRPAFATLCGGRVLGFGPTAGLRLFAAFSGHLSLLLKLPRGAPPTSMVPADKTDDCYAAALRSTSNHSSLFLLVPSWFVSWLGRTGGGGGWGV